MLKVWDIINEMENLTIEKPNDLKIGDVYIVMFKEEKYRATFISVLRGPQKKYKVKFYLYLFKKNEKDVLILSCNYVYINTIITIFCFSFF